LRGLDPESILPQTEERMLVLGIETSTMQGGVALVGDRGLASEYTLNVEATHSERLLPTIDRMLQDAGVGLDDLGGIAVSIGPGSFTGLRIGLSTVKGLAYATGLPVVSVPTLEALAWTVPGARWQVCPVLDARKQEIYTALFLHEPAGLHRLMEDVALAPEDLCGRIRKPTLFLGDGVEAYAEVFRALLGDKLLLPPVASRGARPACVAELGRGRLLRGERDAVESLVPRYLRPSEAELRRQRAPAAREH
jgi:tRNA threonylcarbamoyladenosine biosynthesis protein TsaB